MDLYLWMGPFFPGSWLCNLDQLFQIVWAYSLCKRILLSMGVIFPFHQNVLHCIWCSIWKFEYHLKATLVLQINYRIHSSNKRLRTMKDPQLLTSFIIYCVLWTTVSFYMRKKSHVMIDPLGSESKNLILKNHSSSQIYMGNILASLLYFVKTNMQARLLKKKKKIHNVLKRVKENSVWSLFDQIKINKIFSLFYVSTKEKSVEKLRLLLIKKRVSHKRVW